MNCTLSEQILKDYPNQFEAMFISVSGDSITDSHTGFLDDLKKVANATAEPQFKTMKPVRNYSELFNKPVFIESIEFFPYDTTMLGSEGQDDTVITEIVDSRTSNDIYPQSLYRNAMMPLNWQPNYFGFSLFVNSCQLVEGLDRANNLSIADMSIGSPLPCCIQINKEVERVNSIELLGRLSQYISVADKYQNYPLLAKISIRGKG